MKKTLAIVAALAFVLTGCTNNSGNPEPTQTPTATQATSVSTIEPDPTTAPTKTSEPEPTQEETTKPVPTAEQSSASAKTPAVEFAERWGKKYPNVQEYAIIKAANGVCAVTEQYPDWTNSTLAQAAINEIVTGFGLNDNDGVEFAQDAQQNYCPSIANPT
jgi:hypothetical protein